MAPAPEAPIAKRPKAVRKRANSANSANSATGESGESGPVGTTGESGPIDAAAPPAVETDSTRLDRIREAAYQMYVARGHQDGHDLEDWLAAEAALGGEPAPLAGAAPGGSDAA